METYTLSGLPATVEDITRSRNSSLVQFLQPFLQLMMYLVIERDISRSRDNEISIDLLLLDQSFDLFDLTSFKRCNLFCRFLAICSQSTGSSIVGIWF